MLWKMEDSEKTKRSLHDACGLPIVSSLEIFKFSCVLFEDGIFWEDVSGLHFLIVNFGKVSKVVLVGEKDLRNRKFLSS